MKDDLSDMIAYLSLEYARTGDVSQIAQRLRLDMLSDDERQFLADYLIGKVKPRKLKGGRSLVKAVEALKNGNTKADTNGITALDKDMIVQTVIALTAGGKREAAIAAVCKIFHVKRSYVFKLLKEIDPKRLAAMKARIHED